MKSHKRKMGAGASAVLKLYADIGFAGKVEENHFYSDLKKET